MRKDKTKKVEFEIPIGLEQHLRNVLSSPLANDNDLEIVSSKTKFKNILNLAIMLLAQVDNTNFDYDCTSDTRNIDNHDKYYRFDKNKGFRSFCRETGKDLFKSTSTFELIERILTTKFCTKHGEVLPSILEKKSGDNRTKKQRSEGKKKGYCRENQYRIDPYIKKMKKIPFQMEKRYFDKMVKHSNKLTQMYGVDDPVLKKEFENMQTWILPDVDGLKKYLEDNWLGEDYKGAVVDQNRIDDWIADYEQFKLDIKNPKKYMYVKAKNRRFHPLNRLCKPIREYLCVINDKVEFDAKGLFPNILLSTFRCEINYDLLISKLPMGTSKKFNIVNYMCCDTENITGAVTDEEKVILDGLAGDFKNNLLELAEDEGKVEDVDVFKKDILTGINAHNGYASLLDSFKILLEKTPSFAKWLKVKKYNSAKKHKIISEFCFYVEKIVMEYFFQKITDNGLCVNSVHDAIIVDQSKTKKVEELIMGVTRSVFGVNTDFKKVTFDHININTPKPLKASSTAEVNKPTQTVSLEKPIHEEPKSEPIQEKPKRKRQPSPQPDNLNLEQPIFKRKPKKLDFVVKTVEEKVESDDDFIRGEERSQKIFFEGLTPDKEKFGYTGIESDDDIIRKSENSVKEFFEQYV